MTQEKNKGGRPPMFKTVEELEEKIQEYFDNPPLKQVVINGKPIDLPFISITGLTLHLGFCDRKSFYEYEDKPKFTHTIKKARTRIERRTKNLLLKNCSARK